VTEHAHAEAHGHSSVRTYLVVLAILAVVTLVEVATYFIPWFEEHRSVLFWSLSAMAIAKFWLVVGFYMHLQYDASYYRRVFVVPVVIAVVMTVVVTVLTLARLSQGG